MFPSTAATTKEKLIITLPPPPYEICLSVQIANCFFFFVYDHSEKVKENKSNHTQIQRNNNKREILQKEEKKNSTKSIFSEPYKCLNLKFFFHFSYEKKKGFKR